MLQEARERVFWLYDRLKGSIVKNHLRDVSEILAGPDENAKSKIKDRLLSILDHAKDSTAYYANLKDSKELQDFPVINKNIIRENYNQFISNNFDREKLKPAVTSGSTGTPFKVLHDRNKVLRNTADTLYFSSRAGYELGQRLYYLKIWNKTNRKSRLSLFMQNIVPVDVTDQSDIFLEDFAEHINNDKAPKSLLGYSSAFEVL
jgi:phenylacetate-CoA ligase